MESVKLGGTWWYLRTEGYDETKRRILQLWSLPKWLNVATRYRVATELYTAKRKKKYCKQNCFIVTRLRKKKNQLSSKCFATSPVSPKYNFESFHTQALHPHAKKNSEMCMILQTAMQVNILKFQILNSTNSQKQNIEIHSGITTINSVKNTFEK